jgi:DnaJ like chaperone protein
MSATELLVSVVCLALGYWVVAVFLPSLLETDAVLAEDAASTPGDSGEAHGQTDASLSDSAEWFEVLDIPESSLREDIVVAYKRRIRQYHPDLVARMGPELRELAERKSRQINAAYDAALKLRSGTYEA